MTHHADAAHIVLNSAGCGAMMQEYAHLLAQPATDAALSQQAKAFSQKVVDVMVLLSQKTMAPFSRPVPLRVTYHGACHLHHAQHVGFEPFKVLLQVPELDLIPLAGFDRCCGSAGIYNIDQPEISQDLLSEKMLALAMTRADVIVAGNPGCLLQIQAGLRQQQPDKPMADLLHPLELLAYAYRQLDLPALDALVTAQTDDTTESTPPDTSPQPKGTV
jgi:glycolate oxidase iron-sulfur subunit